MNNRYQISCSIMHHPSRADLLPAITAQVPHANIIVSKGLGLSEVWPVAKQAWSTRDPQSLGSQKPTHHIVLQDDILPCRNFMKTVERLVWLKPHSLIGLYHNKCKLDIEAKENNIHWIKCAGVTTAQALLIPVAKIDEFLLWERQNVMPSYLHDDGRMMLWIYKTKAIECLFTAPTLVEHIRPKGSLVGHTISKNVSGWFVGKDTSGLIFDWSRGCNNPLRSSNGYPGKNAKKHLIENHPIPQGE